MERLRPEPTDEELLQAVQESGMVDGEWHSAAALNPNSGGFAPGRYPIVENLHEDEPISWTWIYETGAPIAMLSWYGDPVTRFSCTGLNDAGHKVMFYCDDLGLKHMPIEEARKHMLAKYAHSEIRQGTVKEADDAFSVEYDRQLAAKRSR